MRPRLMAGSLGEDMRSAILIFLTVSALAVVVYSFGRWREYRQFVWRTESITATILRDDAYLRIGQFLNLDQQLHGDELGWTNMKLDVPESWSVESLVVKGGSVNLRLHDGRIYTLRCENVDQLLFEILDGDGGEAKSDDDLEHIWHTYALAENT